MAKFIKLSEMIVNVDAIRYIVPGMARPTENHAVGCTVYFINATEAYCFYGQDAEKIMAVAESCMAEVEAGAAI